MLAIALLVLIGSAIVLGRLYVNGTREEPPNAPRRAPAQVAAAAGRGAARTAGAPRTAGSRRKAGSTAAAAEAWAGGPCPSCGAETVPGAKFCGECGQRLLP